ncbi:glycosyltransferase family 4 protein [Fusobacterium mortiferum]|uniref:glycosyltransferase family 4 protein n=1 Tax=Fusobacterium mortiferum TaxID=850 RepID=UPI0022E44A42|nr:glycosyltransferase family 4 protein [Fusobacterium mortiferum]
MKKIIHICQSAIGGTVEYIDLLVSNLDKNEYENIVICPSYGNLKSRMDKRNIKTYVVEMEREISPLKDIKDTLIIRKILKKEKPDTVYLHSSKAGALGRLASIFLKNKVLYNSHGWAFNMECSEKKKRFYALIEKVLLPLTDIIINISEDEYQSAINYGLNPQKMIVIENGIDIEKYKENTKVKFLDKFVIGFVGRLSKQKNPMFMIDICEELIKNGEDNFLFYIVGDGELRKEFQEKIKSKNIEKYFYLKGWSEKVEEEIRNFDVALMISKWEGFGLVVCEYMAARKPIITVAVGGVKNILNEENSFYINGYLKGEFVKKIIEVKCNDKKVKNKIEKAYKHVKEKFDIGKMIKKLETIF